MTTEKTTKVTVKASTKALKKNQKTSKDSLTYTLKEMMQPGAEKLRQPKTSALYNKQDRVFNKMMKTIIPVEPIEKDEKKLEKK